MLLGSRVFFNTTSVNKLCLFTLVLFSFRIGYSQKLDFKVEIDSIAYQDIELFFFKEGQMFNRFKPNKKFVVSIQKDVIHNADSIVATFSFFKQILYKQDFQNSSIKLNKSLDLTTIVLRGDYKKYLGPNLPDISSRVLSIHETGVVFPSVLLENKDVFGFRIYLKNRGFLRSRNSIGKSFSFKYIGFINTESHLIKPQMVYQDTTIYLNNKKKDGWFDIKIEKIELSKLTSFDNIGVLLQPMQDEMVVGYTSRESYPDFYTLGAFGSKYKKFKKSPTLMRFQWIYNSTEEN